MNKTSLLLLISIITSFIVYFLSENYFAHNAALSISIAWLMVFLWISESIDLPVVGLLPLLVFPVLGLQTIEKTAAYYSSPVIFLFLSGFIIGIAIEKSCLHRRLALYLISKIGTSGNRILLAFIITTGLISMWISNTATTLMMLPLAVSIISTMSTNTTGNFQNFRMSLILSVAYAANFGGLATLIGSPPNLVMANYIEKTYNRKITFLEWMHYGMPISIILLLMLFLVLIFLLPSRYKQDSDLVKRVNIERKEAGKISDLELKTLIIFIGVVFFWIFGILIQKYLPLKINDTSVGIAGAILFFIVRSNGKAILNWQDTKELPWGVLLLFGGGLALAGALEDNKVLEVISNAAPYFAKFSYAAIIFMIVFFSIFSSEILNNISQVVIFTPIVCGLALSLNQDLVMFSIALTIAAGSASMFPTGTPPNAIVFATGAIPMKRMLKVGFILNLFATAIISLVLLSL